MHKTIEFVFKHYKSIWVPALTTLHFLTTFYVIEKDIRVIRMP